VATGKVGFPVRETQPNDDVPVTLVIPAGTIHTAFSVILETLGTDLDEVPRGGAEPRVIEEAVEKIRTDLDEYLNLFRQLRWGDTEESIELRITGRRAVPIARYLEDEGLGILEQIPEEAVEAGTVTLSIPSEAAGRVFEHFHEELRGEVEGSINLGLDTPAGVADFIAKVQRYADVFAALGWGDGYDPDGVGAKSVITIPREWAETAASYIIDVDLKNADTPEECRELLALAVIGVKLLEQIETPLPVPGMPEIGGPR
jgi:hypothetical protein